MLKYTKRTVTGPGKGKVYQQATEPFGKKVGNDLYNIAKKDNIDINTVTYNKNANNAATEGRSSINPIDPFQKETIGSLNKYIGTSTSRLRNTHEAYDVANKYLNKVDSTNTARTDKGRLNLGKYGFHSTKYNHIPGYGTQKTYVRNKNVYGYDKAAGKVTTQAGYNKKAFIDNPGFRSGVQSDLRKANPKFDINLNKTGEVNKWQYKKAIPIAPATSPLRPLSPTASKRTPGIMYQGGGVVKKRTYIDSTEPTKELTKITTYSDTDDRTDPANYEHTWLGFGPSVYHPSSDKDYWMREKANKGMGILEFVTIGGIAKAGALSKLMSNGLSETEALKSLENMSKAAKKRSTRLLGELDILGAKGAIKASEREKLLSKMKGWDEELMMEKAFTKEGREALKKKMKGWGMEMEKDAIKKSGARVADRPYKNRKAGEVVIPKMTQQKYVKGIKSEPIRKQMTHPFTKEEITVELDPKTNEWMQLPNKEYVARESSIQSTPNIARRPDYFAKTQMEYNGANVKRHDKGGILYK